MSIKLNSLYLIEGHNKYYKIMQMYFIIQKEYFKKSPGQIFFNWFLEKKDEGQREREKYQPLASCMSPTSIFF